MNSSKPSILFWCLFSLLVNLFSCKPEEEKKVDPQKHYYYLSPEQLAKSPYFTNPLFDTLTYANTKGDTFVFAKYKVDTGYVITSDVTQGSPAKNLYYYQYIQNKYYSLKGNGKFGVAHYKEVNTNSGYRDDVIEFSLNDLLFFVDDEKIGNKIIGIPFYDEIIVKGRSYKSVAGFKRIFNGDTISLLINNSHGLISSVNLQMIDSLILENH